jgi:hypothetical protein
MISLFQDHDDEQPTSHLGSKRTPTTNAMYHRLAGSLAITLLFSMPPARAASRHPGHSGAAAKERAAKKACVTGDVKTGIDILGDLYVDSGDATYVFNQGRCYEQNHRLEDAIDRFREYLRKVPDAQAKDKADANAHIADCEALLAKQNGNVPATQAAALPPSPQPVLAPAPPTPMPPPVAVVPTQPLAPKSDGLGLRIAGAVTTAVGLCAVGTGVILAIKERSLTNDINAKFSQSKESSRASYETWGYVSYGVGAAAIVGGATLYYLGWRSGKAEPANTDISLLPTLTPDSMTFVLNGNF